MELYREQRDIIRKNRNLLPVGIFPNEIKSQKSLQEAVSTEKSNKNLEKNCINLDCCNKIRYFFSIHKNQFQN